MPTPNPGIKSTRVVFLGKQTADLVTAVTPTDIWRSPSGMPQDKRKIEDVETQEGLVGGVNRTATSYIESAISFSSADFVFEQFIHLLRGGLGIATAGTGTPGKTYTGTLPTSGSTVPLNQAAAYTIVAGDKYQKDQMVNCVCNKIVLSGKQKEMVKMAAEWQGGNITQYSVADPVITVPTDYDFLAFGQTTTFLDPISSAYGTTQVLGHVLGFEITIELKWEDKNPSDGQIYKSFSVFTGYKITVKLTVEQEAYASRSGSGLKAYLVNQNAIHYQMTGLGPLLTGGVGNKKLQVQLPLKVMSVSEIKDIGGNDIVEATLMSKYDPTSGEAGNVSVTCNLANIP